MDKHLAKRIGDAARAARRGLRLTQPEVAERVGISVEFYGRIERAGTIPSVPTLSRLAEALGISADLLLGREGTSYDGAQRAREPAPTEVEAPEVRRIARRLPHLQPRSLRAIGVLVGELERTGRKPSRRRDARRR